MKNKSNKNINSKKNLAVKFKKTLIQANVAMLLGVSSGITFAACTAGVDGNGKTTYTCNNEATQWVPITGYDHIVINTSADWNISGPQGVGLYSNNSTWNVNQLSITTSGSASDAVRTNGNGIINIGDNLYIKTTGSSADGINSTEDSNGRITIGNGASISTVTGVGVRANISKNAAWSNIITVGDNATIKTTGSGSNLLDSVGYGVYAGIRSWVASSAYGNARATLGNNSNITTEGSSAHAVYANRGGKIQLGSTTIETKKANAYGLYAETGANGNGSKGGEIHLLNDTKINVIDGGLSIYANGADSIIASHNADTNTNTSGKFDVTGDMKVNNLGTIDLRMTNGSSFIGNTSITGTGGTLNLDIAGASSVWQMKKDSQLTTLKLANNAQVHLGDQSAAITPSNQVTLTTKNLSGNGHFYVRTDIVGSDDTGLGINISDKIKVTGTSSGNHKILVSDARNGGAIGTEIVRVAEIADGGAQFTLSNINGYVEVGAYKYGLKEVDPLTRAGAEKHWYLIQTNDEGGAGENGNGGGNGGKTDTADHSANILNINYLLNYVETQTLLQRMGELRQSENTKGDVWVRAYTGKLDSFTDGILSGFDLDYSGVQIGADKKFSYNNSDFYLGAMTGTAEAKANYRKGDGKTTSYHAGLYATYKANNGFYVDGIAKYVRMENTLNTETGDGTPVKGDGHTNGFSIGIEAGKRFYFTQPKSGWYAEPQAQLTYSHQNGTTIGATNLLRTDLDSYDSTLGRISAIVGYSIAEGKNPVDVYFKTGYVKEFDGQTGYTYNKSIHEGYKLNGDWWDNGIGITAQINKQHNLYLDATYSTGSKFDQMQLNAGYRYGF